MGTEHVRMSVSSNVARTTCSPLGALHRMTHPLTPAQQRALNGVSAGLSIGRVVTLTGSAGMGKTTLLRHVHAVHGGAFLTTKEYIDTLRPCHPLAMEETFEQLVMDALLAHDCV